MMTLKDYGSLLIGLAQTMEEDDEIGYDYSENSSNYAQSTSHENSEGEHDEWEPHGQSRLGGLNQQGFSVLQQRSLLPQVENIKRLILQRDEMQLSVQLHHTNDFLLTFTETFAEVANNQDSNDFCGLGGILAELLASESSNPEALIPACRCVKIMAEHGRLAARQMVESRILSSLVGFLENIHYIDLAEAALDCLPCFALLFPRKCLHSHVLNASLAHIDFFPRATQLSTLKAATLISKAVRRGDLDRYILPILPNLLDILKSASKDMKKLFEVLKIYTNLAAFSDIAAALITDDDLAVVLEMLCQQVKDPSVWPLAFRIYATVTLERTKGQAGNLIELSLTQLESHLADTKYFNEQTIVSILKVLIPIFISNEQHVAPLPVSATSNPDSGQLTISTLEGLKIDLYPRDSSKVIVSTLEKQALLHMVDEILTNLPSRGETKAICIILAHGVCLSCTEEALVDTIFLENFIEDLVEIMSPRDSTLALLSLCVLSVLFVKVQWAKPLFTKALDGGNYSGSWKLPSQSRTLIKSLQNTIEVLGFEIVNLEKFSIEELILKVENMLRKKLVELGASETPSKKELKDHLSEQIQKIYCKDELEGSESFVKIIDQVQRHISRNNQGYPMFLLNNNKTWSHPLEQLAVVVRLIKVSLTAEIEGKRVFGNRLVSVDPLSSPAELLETIIISRPGSQLDAGVVDVTVDLSSTDTAPAPLACINWEKHCCMIRLEKGESFVVDPNSCFLSYVLHDIQKADDISKLIQRLFSGVVEMQVYGDVPSKEQPLLLSPVESPDLKSCINALSFVAQSYGQDEELMKRLVNKRLDGKLARQLRQPLLVTGQAIPSCWKRLMEEASFLFDYNTKLDYLAATKFGVGRYLDRIQVQNRTETGVEADDSLVRLARIRRLKFIIDRDQFDRQSRLAISCCAIDKRRVLEFQYAGDVGVGLGPTMEFYTTLSRSLQDPKLGMWLDEGEAKESSGGLVTWRSGLYPSPNARREDFTFLGLLVGRAILDGRLLDLPLNTIFIDYILGRPHPPSLKTLSLVDFSLSMTLRRLSEEEVPSEDPFLGLYFVHPGFPEIELCPNGRDKAVNLNNYEEFLDQLLLFILDRGIKEVTTAFSVAFQSILPLDSLRIFSALQFKQLLNGEPSTDTWDVQCILREIHVDHGYTKENDQILWLAQVFAGLNLRERGRLIQFLTGAPQLPIGGWGQLRPTFTVVCRTSERPDEALPTVMTCANYLKLPRYSSKEILQSKLLLAIEEGQGSFLLS